MAQVPGHAVHEAVAPSVSDCSNVPDGQEITMLPPERVTVRVICGGATVSKLRPEEPAEATCATSSGVNARSQIPRSSTVADPPSG